MNNNADPIWNSLKDYELAYEGYPTLYRIGGEYMPGLAWLMGAFYCLRGDPLVNNAHEFIDDKCVHCEVRRRKKP